MGETVKGVAPTPNAIMTGAEMRPLLAASKTEPVYCAIGLTDAKLGVILLHKKTKPKQLVETLKADAKKVKLGLDSGSLRFGIAEVDPKIDAALVRFTINKAAPGGIEPKLREQLKGSGCTKVEFAVDESLEKDGDDKTLKTEGSGGTTQPEPTVEPEKPVDQNELAYEEKLKIVVPEFQQALKDGKGSPQKLVPLLEFVRNKAKAGDYVTALDGLNKLEGILKGLGAPLGRETMPNKAESEETAYKKRLAEIAERIKTDQNDKVKLPDDVGAMLKAAAELASKKDFGGALKALNTLEASLTTAEGRYRIFQEYVKAMQALGNSTFGFPNDPSWFAGQVQPAKDLTSKLNGGVKVTSTVPIPELNQALLDLQNMIPQVKEAGACREAYAKYMTGFRPQVTKALAIKPGNYQPLAQALAALRKADTERTSEGALKGATLDETNRLLNSVDTELKQVMALSAQRVSAMTNDKGTKKSDLRANVLEWMDSDPELLKRLCETPEGRKTLDDLVADIGKTAKGKTDNKFMVAALEGRYGSKFSGDLENSAGPRLYRVFGMVPDEHTRQNPKIAEVKRNKNYEGMSWYSTGTDEDEGVGKHHIIINGARTGGIKGWVVDALVGSDNPMTHGAPKYQNVKGGKKINAFDAVTLHEIGHGVDEKEGFMSGKGSTADYGGWLEHAIEEVADIIGTELGFYSDFKAQPRAMLRSYLANALSKNFDPAKMKEQGKASANVTKDALTNDPGVKAADAARLDMDNNGWKKSTVKKHKEKASKAIALKGDGKVLAQAAVEQILSDREMEPVINELMALKPNPGVDWDAMAKHKAVKRCTDIKLKTSDKGLWIEGAGAAKYAVGGRVYQEAYRGDWNSYDPAALAKRTTNYQFRAPGEWFADAYSAFFLGKLPDNHPLNGWLSEQVAPK